MFLRAGKIVLDLLTRQVWVGDRSVKLSAREFTLAETFVRHPGQVMSREQLLSHVWGYNYDPGSNVVDVCVGYLRKKQRGVQAGTSFPSHISGSDLWDAGRHWCADFCFSIPRDV